MNRKRQAWLVLAAAFLASLAVSLNQFKVPPAMPVLLLDLNMDTETGGWLMSAFSITGLLLAIPAAWIMGKFGGKISGLIAVGFTFLGAILGALANEPTVLFLGRVIEGIGLGLIAVVPPAVISMWFPPEERGMPMGIWSTWGPVGTFLMFNLAGPLLQSFGWRSLWWFGAIFAAVAFVVYAVVVREPPEAEGAEGQSGGPNGSIGKLLLNPAGWLLAVVFGTFSFAFLAYSTWAPSYFNEGLKINLETANFYASLTALTLIPAMIISGWLLDRLKNKFLVLTVGLPLTALLLIWSFQLGSAAIVAPYMLILGLVCGFIPPSVFTLAPKTVLDPRLAGYAIGITSVGLNIGMLIGPPIVGASIAGGNWKAGIIPLVVSIVIAMVATLLLPRSMPKR